MTTVRLGYLFSVLTRRDSLTLIHLRNPHRPMGDK